MWPKIMKVVCRWLSLKLFSTTLSAEPQTSASSTQQTGGSTIKKWGPGEKKSGVPFLLHPFSCLCATRSDGALLAQKVRGLLWLMSSEKREIWTHAQEESHTEMKAEIGRCLHEPGNTKGCQQPQEAGGQEGGGGPPCSHMTASFISYICKDPISKWGHILRCWGVRITTRESRGAHNSAHNSP